MAVMLFCVSGCAPWTTAQLELVTQARRGVTNVQKRSEERAVTARELGTLRRQRLNEAFDQDVREKQSIEAAWVIEHRKAYSAALDAYARQQAGEDAAALAEKRDLQAVDAALQRLAWLISVQAKFDLLAEVGDGKH